MSCRIQNIRSIPGIIFVWFPILMAAVLVLDVFALAASTKTHPPHVRTLGVTSNVHPYPAPKMASSEDRLLHIGLKSALSLPFEPVYAMQPRDRSTWPNDKFNTQQYHYDKNGVSIKVTYRIYEQGNVPSIDQIADRVSKQLSHIPGLELIDLTQQRAIHLNPANQPASETNNLTSIAHSARFLFQPFAKEIHYEVRNYIEGYRQWMVSVSYKSCDARGRILVKEFLDTLAFIPVGT